MPLCRAPGPFSDVIKLQNVQAQRAAVIQKLSLPLLRFFGNKQDLVTALLHFRPEAIQNLCKQLMAKSIALSAEAFH